MVNNKWFVRPNPNPTADLRLICFPYAGGSSTTYLSWVKELPKNVELVIIQTPGRGSRMCEVPYSDMDTLVGDLVKIIPQLLNKPYILFGHSLGSRVAFELMSQLKMLNHPPPIHFIASGSRGPQYLSNNEPIYHLKDEEFINEIRGLNGTPPAVLDNKELMDLFLPMLKADFEIADKYCYNKNETFNCPISVLGGEDDFDITYSKLSGWGEHFTHDAEIHMFVGNHFFIDSNKEGVLKKVNNIIALCLVGIISVITAS
ncbi:thioesterase II family protein [Colwellia psychrerythraea]|uniref:Oleoyl-(Acyl-carrier-protein) hydrolase n=1 Tax=Colwellia psychrerythraea TaxID=28229 RepID=A0A099KB15_COLPS|nr:thioesterase domain-containing protein [Colwellia psychrerythraea]KGJ86793.1 Oleoyl-(acyl-carrier-protein) hydrolase [Colwellia psychrerythraea]